MSSTYKTDNYNFNKWIGSDIPEMEDFNHDNALVDSLIAGHNGDSVVHITDDERNKWNNQMYIQSYVGTGSATQVVKLNSTFNPRVCIVFAHNTMLGVTDFDNHSHYNYFGFATTYGSVLGMSLSGKSLTVTQSNVAFNNSEYKFFNDKNVMYTVIAIR